MLPLLKNRFFGRSLDEIPAALAETATDVLNKALPERQESTLLRTLGWVSAGFGALALGLVVGRELRQRYQFNRRTPYDFYAHSGDRLRDTLQDVEFGVGI